MNQSATADNNPRKDKFVMGTPKTEVKPRKDRTNLYRLVGGLLAAIFGCLSIGWSAAITLESLTYWAFLPVLFSVGWLIFDACHLGWYNVILGGLTALFSLTIVWGVYSTREPLILWTHFAVALFLIAISVAIEQSNAPKPQVRDRDSRPI